MWGEKNAQSVMRCLPISYIVQPKPKISVYVDIFNRERQRILCCNWKLEAENVWHFFTPFFFFLCSKSFRYFGRLANQLIVYYSRTKKGLDNSKCRFFVLFCFFISRARQIWGLKHQDALMYNWMKSNEPNIGVSCDT